MNILVVTGTFPPRKFGGITTASYNISKELVKRGHKVTIFTTDLGNYPNSRLNVHKIENKEGLEVYYFKNLSNYFAFKYRLFLPFGMLSSIRKKLNEFDIIHLHDFRSFLSIIIHYYAKKNNIPYVLQAHGSVPHLSQKTYIKNFFDKLWGHNILNNANKVIALNDTESKQYQNMGVNKKLIEILPNGINLSEFETLPKKGQFRKKYKIDNDEKIILYLGRLYRSKGIDLLINSFTDLLDEINNIKLIIAGPDDGDLKFLKEKVNNLALNEKVIFTGPLYNRDKLEVFVDANVFVTPNFSGFPLTFLESCACGTPIVTTSNGDELSWINNNVGYVTGYDKNELKNAIIKILTNEKLRTELGNQGKILIKEKFNWDSVSKEIERIYISSLKKSFK